jgi:hypothetical protein
LRLQLALTERLVKNRLPVDSDQYHGARDDPGRDGVVTDPPKGPIRAAHAADYTPRGKRRDCPA